MKGIFRFSKPFEQKIPILQNLGGNRFTYSAFLLGGNRI